MRENKRQRQYVIARMRNRGVKGKERKEWNERHRENERGRERKEKKRGKERKRQMRGTARRESKLTLHYLSGVLAP